MMRCFTGMPKSRRIWLELTSKGGQKKKFQVLGARLTGCMIVRGICTAKHWLVPVNSDLPKESTSKEDCHLTRMLNESSRKGNSGRQRIAL